MSIQFWLPPNVKWSHISPASGINYADSHYIYLSIPVAFMMYAAKQILIENFLVPVSKQLNFQMCKKSQEIPNIPSKIEMFYERSWELIFYTFSMIVGVCALWNEPYFWNFVEAGNAYPFHVNIKLLIHFNTNSNSFLQAVSDSVTFLYVLTTGYYIFDLMMFVCYSKRFSYAISYILHHIVTLLLLYFSWMMNAHRVGTLLIFINNILTYFFQSIAKVTKLLEMPYLKLISFWIFFMIRMIAKLIFLQIIYLGIFEVDLPIYPAFVVMYSFLIMLVIHNVYFTKILFKMACKHYSWSSLKAKQD